MSVFILDSILEYHTAEEMALECKYENADEAAKTWFSEIYAESDWTVDERPTYSRYVCDIEGGWELWYDYGACYYFAITEEGEK